MALVVVLQAVVVSLAAAVGHLCLPVVVDELLCWMVVWVRQTQTQTSQMLLEQPLTMLFSFYTSVLFLFKSEECRVRMVDITRQLWLYTQVCTYCAQ